MVFEIMEGRIQTSGTVQVSREIGPAEERSGRVLDEVLYMIPSVRVRKGFGSNIYTVVLIPVL